MSDPHGMLSEYAQQSARHSQETPRYLLTEGSKRVNLFCSMHARFEVASQRLAGRCMR
jgi:hypothetical protein